MSRTTSFPTPPVFFRLPNGFIRRHNFSSNTNHFIYREIHTKPAIRSMVQQCVRENTLDLYKIAEEQYKKCPHRKDPELVQKMFPLELVNPEKYKQEQEHKEWAKAQAEKLKKWKETHLAKKFYEKKQGNKRFFVEADDLDDSDSDSDSDDEEMEKENHHDKPPVKNTKTPVQKRIGINKPCCI